MLAKTLRNCHSKRFWGLASLHFRFLTPFVIHSSRQLRNSLCSDILAARLRRVPSKDTWEGSIFYGHNIHPPKPGRENRGEKPFPLSLAPLQKSSG